MAVRVFMSHTKYDRECCDKFDSAAARVGLRVFRSEFETLESPSWRTIKDEMDKSSALFLLVGKELVKAQAHSESSTGVMGDWKFTQNWIAYEVGLACQRGIDVWVICDSVKINFPVPYLNNYDVWGIRREMQGSLRWIKWVFSEYDKGHSFPVGQLGKERICKCPHCHAVFNLHSAINPNEEAICPTCLKSMVFESGWGSRRVTKENQ